MDDSGSVRVCACRNGRVHLQVGFVTLCLDAKQFTELVRKGNEALHGHVRAGRDTSPSGLSH